MEAAGGECSWNGAGGNNNYYRNLGFYAYREQYKDECIYGNK